MLSFDFHPKAVYFEFHGPAFSIFEWPIIHFVCPPPPPPPQKNIAYLFLNALGDTAYSEKHLKTKVYAKFGVQTKCITGHSKIEIYPRSKLTDPSEG